MRIALSLEAQLKGFKLVSGPNGTHKFQLSEIPPQIAKKVARKGWIFLNSTQILTLANRQDKPENGGLADCFPDNHLIDGFAVGPKGA